MKQSKDSDIEAEARIAWLLGKDLGLITKVDSKAIQAILEEMSIAMGRKARKGRRIEGKARKELHLLD